MYNSRFESLESNTQKRKEKKNIRKRSDGKKKRRQKMKRKKKNIVLYFLPVFLPNECVLLWGSFYVARWFLKCLDYIQIFLHPLFIVFCSVFRISFPFNKHRIFKIKKSLSSTSSITWSNYQQRIKKKHINFWYSFTQCLSLCVFAFCFTGRDRREQESQMILEIP